MIPQQRKKRKSTTEEDFEKVVLLNSFGTDKNKIVAQTGMDKDTVRRIVIAYETVKARDWAAALDYVNKGYRLKYLQWAADRMGVEIPENVAVAYDTWCALHNSKAKVEEPKAEAPKAEAVEEPKDEKPQVERSNENLYLCKVLEALAKTNELLEQLMDVVIPKYAVDLQDNFDVNTDLVYQQLKTCTDSLEKISFNTRERGA